MKKLTLLILLASITLMGFGQEKETATVFDSTLFRIIEEPDTSKIIWSQPTFTSLKIKDYRSVLVEDVDSTSSRYLVNGMRIVTLGDLERYFEACYNDSTLVKHWEHSYTTLAYTGRRVKTGSKVVRKEWTHREPNFPGFFEWIIKN